MFICGSALIVTLVIYALGQNINLFYTPQKLIAAKLAPNTRVRVGGMVVTGSLQHAKDLEVSFKITDYHNEVTVSYQGVLPDLFREGQGVVALGRMDVNNVFKAEQILAKHDENYMPPELIDVT